MKQERAQHTARKLLNAAMQLFVRQGYHGTSIADIANATGMTKGAIYFHFKSKDALLTAILDQFATLYLDRMIAHVEAVEGTALDKIKHYLRFTVNFTPGQLNLCFTHLATELFAGRKRPDERIERIYTKYHRFLKEIFEAGRAEGAFREDIDPALLAFNLIGALEGNLIQWNLNRKKFSGNAFARSFVKLYLYGIETPTVTKTFVAGHR